MGSGVGGPGSNPYGVVKVLPEKPSGTSSATALGGSELNQQVNSQRKSGTSGTSDIIVSALGRGVIGTVKGEYAEIVGGPKGLKAPRLGSHVATNLNLGSGGSNDPTITTTDPKEWEGLEEFGSSEGDVDPESEELLTELDGAGEEEVQGEGEKGALGGEEVQEQEGDGREVNEGPVKEHKGEIIGKESQGVLEASRGIKTILKEKLLEVANRINNFVKSVISSLGRSKTNGLELPNNHNSFSAREAHNPRSHYALMTPNETSSSKGSSPSYELQSKNSEASGPRVIYDDSSITGVKVHFEASYTKLIVPGSAVKVESRLGGGAYGEVKRAQYNGKDFAIKSPRYDGENPENKTFEEIAKDSFAEARIHASILKNENVLRLEGAVVRSNPEGSIFDVQQIVEFCPGGSLDKIYERGDGVAKGDFFLSNIEKNGDENNSVAPLSADQKKALVHERKRKMIHGVASGLSHLHSQNIIHRDLAARNILLSAPPYDQASTAKVSDFGMAKILEGDSKVHVTASNFGPIKWMAPEALQKETSKASDVWSLAVVILEVLTEDPPFKEMNNVEIALQVSARETGLNALKKSEINLDNCESYGLTKSQYEILERCFAFSPEDRPKAEEVATAFA